jgi:hypothetical protein
MSQMYESKALPLKNMPNMGNLDLHWIEEEIESQYMTRPLMVFCLIIEKQVVKIVMNCILLLILCSLTQLLIIMEDLTTNGCLHNSSNDVNEH